MTGNLKLTDIIQVGQQEWRKNCNNAKALKTTRQYCNRWNYGQDIELCTNNTIAYALGKRQKGFRKACALYIREIVDNFEQPLNNIAI